MNKKMVAVAFLAGIAIIFFSISVKDFISRRSARLSDAASLKSMESFLTAADEYGAKRDYLKAKGALLEFIERFPDLDGAVEAKKEIEKLNINILFSDIITRDSISYEIQSGDALSKIASRFGTTVELLKKANGLSGDLIIPGKFLKVNKTKFNIVVDKSVNTLMLKEPSGETVKTYPVSTGKDFSTPAGVFKIEEKLIKPVWYKIGAIVEPDSSEYELGTRWMGLSVDGYGIHGTKDEASIGKYITKGCVRMRNADAEELYAIVPPGTEVTIVD